LIVDDAWKNQLLCTLREVITFASAALGTVTVAARMIHFGDFAAVVALVGFPAQCASATE